MATTSKRRALLGVLIVGAILAGAAAWWFVWVPNWRPPLRLGETYGIDVSAHQATIEWELVAEDDVSFAYIKATEGGDFVDDRFAENWSGAKKAGLQRGAYHFFTLCTPGAEQANNFLRIAPAVDLELAGTAALVLPNKRSIENYRGSSTWLRTRGGARLCSTSATIGRRPTR